MRFIYYKLFFQKLKILLLVVIASYYIVVRVGIILKILQISKGVCYEYRNH